MSCREERHATNRAINQKQENFLNNTFKKAPEGGATNARLRPDESTVAALQVEKTAALAAKLEATKKSVDEFTSELEGNASLSGWIPDNAISIVIWDRDVLGQRVVLLVDNLRAMLLHSPLSIKLGRRGVRCHGTQCRG